MTSSALDTVLTDLEAESALLDEWVAGLDTAGWATVTTPEGWTVAHQVAHLHWTDATSLDAIIDPDAFGRTMRTAAEQADGFVDREAERLAALPPAELLERWRSGRRMLASALRGVPDGQKVPWFGPPMGPASMATARFMETWAHAHDVAEALGHPYPRRDSVRHVAHLGIRTRAFAYGVRGLPVPEEDVRVELRSPAGETWTWGPTWATQRVTGDAYDFALLATRRRHPDDVDVRAEGVHAAQWLTIVQAFAGAPGNDPNPRGGLA